MKPERLRKIYESPALVRVLRIAGNVATVAVAVCVAWATVCLWRARGFIKALELALYPSVGFAAVSIVRRLIDAPRPYEKAGLSGVRCRSGRSMPSRHVFAAAVISAALILCGLPCGIAAACLTVVIAATRILLGYHSAADVTVGAVIGMINGFVTAFLIGK